MREELELNAGRALLEEQDGPALVEPGSGKALGRLRIANPAELLAHAAEARAAQPAWFALPYEDRARVMRRAADLGEQNGDLYVDWLIRENGSAAAKAAFEVGIVVKALREAAAMPSQPQGLVLPSTAGRLSFCRRMSGRPSRRRPSTPPQPRRSWR